jgi:hypothetical protein
MAMVLDFARTITRALTFQTSYFEKIDTFADTRANTGTRAWYTSWLEYIDVN